MREKQDKSEIKSFNATVRICLLLKLNDFVPKYNENRHRKGGRRLRENN